MLAMANTPTTICISAPNGTLAPYLAQIVYWAVNDNVPDPDPHQGFVKIQHPALYRFPQTTDSSIGFGGYDQWPRTVENTNVVIWANIDPAGLRKSFDSKLGMGPSMGAGTDTVHINITASFADRRTVGYNALANELWPTIINQPVATGTWRQKLLSEVGQYTNQVESWLQNSPFIEEHNFISWEDRMMSATRSSDLSILMLSELMGRKEYCQILNVSGSDTLALESLQMATGAKPPALDLDFSCYKDTLALAVQLETLLGPRMIKGVEHTKQQLDFMLSAHHQLV
jgi:hypothetical protein